MKHKSAIRVVTEDPRIFASGVSGPAVFEALEAVCQHWSVEMSQFGWTREQFESQVFSPAVDDQKESVE